MAGEPRRVPTFVLIDGELEEYLTLAEGQERAGIELDGGLAELVDETCAVAIADTAGELPPDMAQAFRFTPAAHRRAVAAAGFVVSRTCASRDPVLVIDAGEQYLMLVAPAPRLEQFLEARYEQPLPLTTPPESPTARWVVSITGDEEVLRTELDVEPRRGSSRSRKLQ